MERQLPDDPVAFIQASVRDGRLYWTYHVNMHLHGRYLSRVPLSSLVSGFWEGTPLWKPRNLSPRWFQFSSRLQPLL